MASLKLRAIFPKGAVVPRPNAARITAVHTAVKNNSIRRLAKYPPPPAGSTYVRTGELGRKWRGVGTPDRVRIENPMPYAGYVEGDDPDYKPKYARSTVDSDQAWMHVGRWPRALEVLDEEYEKLLPRLQDAIVPR